MVHAVCHAACCLDSLPVCHDRSCVRSPCAPCMSHSCWLLVLIETSFAMVHSLFFGVLFFHVFSPPPPIRPLLSTFGTWPPSLCCVAAFACRALCEHSTAVPVREDGEIAGTLRGWAPSSSSLPDPKPLVQIQAPQSQVEVDNDFL